MENGGAERAIGRERERWAKTGESDGQRDGRGWQGWQGWQWVVDVGGGPMDRRAGRRGSVGAERGGMAAGNEPQHGALGPRSALGPAARAVRRRTQCEGEISCRGAHARAQPLAQRRVCALFTPAHRI